MYYCLQTYQGNQINSQIVNDFKSGAIGNGDVIETAAYFSGTSIGGGKYRIVGPHTGTVDNASIVAGSGFRLQAMFDGPVKVSQCGAKPQGSEPTIDNTVPMQTAVDLASATGVASHPGGGIVFLDLWIRITDTITVDGSSTKIVGYSGHSSYRATNGSGMVWDGAAGAPMVEFIDCNGAGCERFGMIGNDTNPPVAIRHTYGDNLPGQGQSITHDQLRIGWSPFHQSGSGKVSKGIEITGSVDLDRFFIRDTEVIGFTGIAFDIGNEQAAWNQLQNCLASNSVADLAGTGIAVQNSTDVNLTNFNANSVATIFKSVLGQQIDCTGIGAENCVVFADLATSSVLNVRGGYSDMNACVEDAPFIVHAAAGAWGRVTLDTVEFRSTGNVWPTGVTILMNQTSSGSSARLTVKNCPAIPTTAVDLSGITGSGELTVDWDVGQTRSFATYTTGQSFNP